MGVDGQLHALAAKPRGSSHTYALSGRLGGPQSRSGRSRRKNSCRESSDNFLYVQPVAQVSGKATVCCYNPVWHSNNDFINYSPHLVMRSVFNTDRITKCY